MSQKEFNLESRFEAYLDDQDQSKTIIFFFIDDCFIQKGYER